MYAEAHKVSDTVSGKVLQKLPFGIILELDKDVTGLLHKNEFSWNPNDNFESYVKIGDVLKLAITKIDTKAKKISLSKKALEDNPWARVDAKVGDLVDYKVTEVKQNGLVVETLGVDGFIPASEATIENKNDLSSYYSVGDEGKAYIIDIKPAEWRLRLSIRKYLKEEERKSYEKYLDNNDEPLTTIGENYADILKK